MDLGELEWENVDWIHMARNGRFINVWWYTVMNLKVS